MADKTTTHQKEKEGSDRAPDIGEKFVGKNERDDDDEIKGAKDEFLEP